MALEKGHWLYSRKSLKMNTFYLHINLPPSYHVISRKLEADKKQGISGDVVFKSMPDRALPENGRDGKLTMHKREWKLS